MEQGGLPLIIGLLRSPNVQVQEHAAGAIRHNSPLLENATVRGRDWYKLLDAPVLALNVTV